MNRLHPSTMIVAFLPKLYDAFRSVLPFLAISFFSGKGDRTELFIAAIGVFGGFGAIASYLTTRYGIQDGHLVCTSGWLFKRDRRIPLDQIQNVNIKQGLLERFLKVVTLEVETAASSGAELKLQVVTEEAAETLRHELSLISTPRAVANVGPTESNIVYRMSRPDLVLGAMTENQGGQIIFALIGTVGAAAIGQAAYRFAQFKEHVPNWFVWAASITLIIGVWLVGWVYGGLQYAVKFAHFTVKSEPGMLRITHGLLTKLQYAVRIKRVEMATVSSTVWQRIVKCCTVRVGTAGSFGEQGTTVPVAMMLPNASTATTLQRVLPDLDPNGFEWTRFPKYNLYVSIVRSVISMAILIGIAWFVTHSVIVRFMPDVRWIAPALVGIIYITTFIDIIVSYKKAAYSITPNYLAVRRGFFRRTISYLPVARIDTVGTDEPSWWRRRGVTKLTANAMVHSITIEMLPLDVAEQVRTMILARPSKQVGYSLNLLKDEPPSFDTSPTNPSQTAQTPLESANPPSTYSDPMSDANTKPTSASSDSP